MPRLLDNFDEILANKDPLLLTLRFDAQTHDNLVAFLGSLTDAAARNLSTSYRRESPAGSRPTIRTPRTTSGS